MKGRFGAVELPSLGRSVAEELLALREGSAPCLGLALAAPLDLLETAGRTGIGFPWSHRHHRQVGSARTFQVTAFSASTRTPTSIEVLQTAFTEAMQRISSPT